MREQVFCINCNKKRWSDITIIAVSNKENKITTTCPKCGTVITKVIGVPQSESNKDS